MLFILHNLLNKKLIYECSVYTGTDVKELKWLFSSHFAIDNKLLEFRLHCSRIISLNMQ